MKAYTLCHKDLTGVIDGEWGERFKVLVHCTDKIFDSSLRSSLKQENDSFSNDPVNSSENAFHTFQAVTLPYPTNEAMESTPVKP